MANEGGRTSGDRATAWQSPTTRSRRTYGAMII